MSAAEMPRAIAPSDAASTNGFAPQIKTSFGLSGNRVIASRTIAASIRRP
jgi:hypothetical protein